MLVEVVGRLKSNGRVAADVEAPVFSKAPVEFIVALFVMLIHSYLRVEEDRRGNKAEIA